MVNKRLISQSDTDKSFGLHKNRKTVRQTDRLLRASKETRCWLRQRASCLSWILNYIASAGMRRWRSSQSHVWQYHENAQRWSLLWTFNAHPCCSTPLSLVDNVLVSDFFPCYLNLVNAEAGFIDVKIDCRVFRRRKCPHRRRDRERR